MVYLEIDKICRVCLNADPCMSPLFVDLNDAECISFPVMIAECTSFKVCRDDGFPQQICFECMERLQSAYSFKTLYEASRRNLIEFLGSISRVKHEHLEPMVVISKNVERPDVTLPSPESFQGTGNKNITIKTEALSSEDESKANNSNAKVNNEYIEKGELIIKEENVSDMETETEESNSSFQVHGDEVSSCLDSGSLSSNKGEPLKAHECAVCHKKFEKRESLVRHRPNHERRYKCTECDRLFGKICNLKRHIVERHGPGSSAVKLEKQEEIISPPSTASENLNGTFQCIKCNKNFKRQFNLKRHQDEVCHENLLPCSECRKIFRGSGALARHIAVVHTGDTPHKCEVCSKAFIGAYELKIHQRLHTGERPFQCPHCPKNYTRSDNLKFHLKRHKENKVSQDGKEPNGGRTEKNEPPATKISSPMFSCDKCHKTFKRKSHLTRHSTVHSKLRPYECTICQRRFTRRHNLKAHIITNHESLSKCNSCDKTFSNEYLLNRHQFETHSGRCLPGGLENPNRPNTVAPLTALANDHESFFKCDECDKKFKLKSFLMKHKICHEKTPRSFACSVCEKAFRRNGDLEKHTRTHTGEKSFECEECGKGFTRLHTLERHIRTHTGERPYECPICLKKFRRLFGVKNHFKTHTKNLPDLSMTAESTAGAASALEHKEPCCTKNGNVEAVKQ